MFENMIRVPKSFEDALIAMADREAEEKMTEHESRKQFEAWVSSPPYEYDVERYPEDASWPGSYMNLGTDLAWQAWQEARKSVEAAQ
jgi:hypothetical protein